MEEVDAEVLRTVEAEMMRGFVDPDREDLDRENTPAREEVSIPHENSASEMDDEVLRAVEDELGPDNDIDRNIERSAPAEVEPVVHEEAEIVDRQEADHDDSAEFETTAPQTDAPDARVELETTAPQADVSDAGVALETIAPQSDALGTGVELDAAHREISEISKEKALVEIDEKVTQSLHAEAVKWYQLAVEQDYAHAQNRLGIMYQSGEGVPQIRLRDDANAAKWRRIATEQGVPSAQVNLGIMYAKGHGVPQDYAMAHMWFNLAAAAGDTDAISNRDFVAGRMAPDQIAEAQRLAREWEPKFKR